MIIVEASSGTRPHKDASEVKRQQNSEEINKHKNNDYNNDNTIKLVYQISVLY